MQTRLSADDLGDVGEKLFALLCGRAGLICNDSKRDRRGWDFVVDLPADCSGTESFDRRPARSCVVQVKSTSNGNPVRLSLSALEPLAKDPKPAFVVVFRLTSDGREVAGYLIHLIGPVLGRVLQRLRQVEASRARPLNKVSVSLKYDELGNRFEPTPEGLRRAIADAFGADATGYVLEKQRQLDELGYDDDRLRAEALFQVESPEHFSRVLVGLEPLKPVALRAFDIRFGVAIPYKGSAFDDVEELRIEPPSMGACHVSIRGAPLSAAAVFDAEAFVGPPLEIDGHVWLLVRHSEFTVSFVGDAVEFNTVGDFYLGKRSLGDWRILTRALSYLAAGDGEISFQFRGDAQTRLSLSMNDRLAGPDLENLPRLSRFMDGWAQLTEMAGVAVTEPFAMEDLWSARPIQWAVDMMTNRTPLGFLAFDLDAFEAKAASVEALYFNSCRLGGAAVTYAVKVTLQRFATEYRSVAFAPIDARPEVLDLQGYGEAQALSSGINVLILPDNVVEIAPYAIDD